MGSTRTSTYVFPPAHACSQAYALRHNAAVNKGSMASLLHSLEQQNFKKCDKEKGGCNHLGTPARKLHNTPHVFTLLMVWEETVSGSSWCGGSCVGEDGEWEQAEEWQTLRSTGDAMMTTMALVVCVFCSIHGEPCLLL